MVLEPLALVERERALKGQAIPATLAASVEPVSEVAARAKAAWARLIRKVYEADPLECPRCKGAMHVIARESTIRG